MFLLVKSSLFSVWGNFPLKKYLNQQNITLKNLPLSWLIMQVLKFMLIFLKESQIANTYFMLLHTENDLTKLKYSRLDCRLMKSQDLLRASALVPFLFFQKHYLFRSVLTMHSHLCKFLLIFLCAWYFDPPRGF